MKRALLLAALLALPLAGCASPSATTASPDTHALAPLTELTHKLGKFLSATVPSFDGVGLHVDVQLPDGEGKFPVLLMDTPYALLGDDASGLQAENGLPFDAEYVAYYVPRGYAVAVAHVRGTGESGGCLTIGDPAEGKDGYALVEWLANQSWSNGRVAMIGTSYVGTTPLETAVWQPPHLTTIVPISAVTEWYRYYFELGTHRRNGDPFPGSSDTDPALWALMGVVPGPRGAASGGADDAACVAQYTAEDDLQDDYDAYWHARDHHAKAANISVPVLYAQGWNDGNVAPTGFPLLWANLSHPEQNRAWLQQHGHGVPSSKKAWHEYVHRWLDHWMLDRENGALLLPNVIIEDNTGAYRNETTWPPSDATWTTLNLTADGKLAAAPASPGSLSFTDTGSGAEDDATDGLDHLQFETAPLAAPMHLAGAPVIRIVGATNMPDTQWDVKVYDVHQTDAGRTRTLVTRGFLDAKHRESLDRASAIKPGTSYAFEFPLHPNDYRLDAGHQLLVIVKSTDDYVVRSAYRATNTIELGPGKSELRLPLVDDATRAYETNAPAPWT